MTTKKKSRDDVEGDKIRLSHAVLSIEPIGLWRRWLGSLFRLRRLLNAGGVERQEVALARALAGTEGYLEAQEA